MTFLNDSFCSEPFFFFKTLRSYILNKYVTHFFHIVKYMRYRKNNKYTHPYALNSSLQVYVSSKNSVSSVLVGSSLPSIKGQPVGLLSETFTSNFTSYLSVQSAWIPAEIIL